jgi:hypothetical protein
MVSRRVEIPVKCYHVGQVDGSAFFTRTPNQILEWNIEMLPPSKVIWNEPTAIMGAVEYIE